MLTNYIPPYDATVVNKLVNKNGAVLMGKTNMDEFAMGSGCVDSIFNPTINPWRSGLNFKLKCKRNSEMGTMQSKLEDDWFISGGSSGGSAVAVATGSVFAAIGSDTGGSTRNPAARVGVVGLKPTYGLVSRYGLIPLTHSMDVPGILTRCVDDAALILNELSGHDVNDSTSFRGQLNDNTMKNIDPRKVTIGIPKEYLCDGLSSEMIDLWNSTSDQLADLGFIIKQVSLPHTKYSISCYSVLNCCEVASNFSCYDGIEFGHRSVENENSVEELYAQSRHEGFSETVRGRILAGNYFLLRENYEKYFVQALKIRRLISNDFDNVFNKDKVDLLLTPVTLSEAPSYKNWILKDNREQVSIEDFCTQPVNMAGLPAISLPCKLSQNGLPLSLQLIGQQFKEFFMLSVAKKIEQNFDFPLLILENDTTQS